MGSAERVLIVGGGISGMTAAVALAQNGIAVHVVEAARRADQLGTGINLQHNALVALEEVGLLDRCLTQGFAWDTISNKHAVTGELLNRNKVEWPSRPGIPGAIGIMRTTLAEILAEAAVKAGVTITYEARIESIKQDNIGVSIEINNGTSDRADLLVAADGAFSQIRRLIFGESHKPSYAGQGVWRFTVPRPKSLDGFTLFRADDGRSVGFLPLSDELAYYFLTETTDQPLWVPPEKAADMLAERLADFRVPEIRDLLPLMHSGWHVSYRPFETLLMPPPWYRGRVVLIGDTAHSLTPQLTSGGGMAIEDAVVLAQEVHRHASIDAALSAYSTRRYDRGKLVFETSRRICEIEKGIEKGEVANRMAGVSVMIEGLRHLGEDY